jgi:adenylate kinase
MIDAPSIHPVTGPPGAGKTTALVSLVEEHPELARFGVRDYGLELAEAGHPLGLKMRDTLLHGHLVSDDLVRTEFLHFLERVPSGTRSVAVEGYPREPRQCADLIEVIASVGAQLGSLIVVDVPDDVVATRVMGRRICTTCGLPAPPETEASCASCGGSIARRNDDAEERLRSRLTDFRALSTTLWPYFRQRNLLHVIDGLQSPDDVRRELRELLLPDSATANAAGRAAVATRGERQ